MQKQLETVSKECVDLHQANRSLTLTLTQQQEQERLRRHRSDQQRDPEEEELKSLQTQLEEEISRHRETKKILDTFRAGVPTHTLSRHITPTRAREGEGGERRGEGGGGGERIGAPLTPSTHHELIGLREKTADQSEQIEVSYSASLSLSLFLSFFLSFFLFLQ